MDKLTVSKKHVCLAWSWAFASRNLRITAGIDADEVAKDKMHKKVCGVGLSAMQRGLTTTSVFSSGIGFFGYQFEVSGARLLASMSLAEAIKLFELCLGDMWLLRAGFFPDAGLLAGLGG